MGFYDSAAKLADRMIKSKGQVMYLFKENPRAYDKNTGKTAVTTMKYKVKGLVLPISTENAYSTMIQAGDQRLLLSALDFNGSALIRPDEDDRIRDVNQNYYTIKEAQPLAPDGSVVVYYDCLIRGVDAAS